MRPSIFIGSSTEGLEIARSAQVELDKEMEVEIWSQGAFGLSEGTLASLVSVLDRFDFALLVLTADDLVTSRGESRPSARDNVLFELGLFMGGLGVERTFLLFDRTNRPALPSDLAGVTAATFEPHASGNLQAALGAPCHLIRKSVLSIGHRPSRLSKMVDDAAQTVEQAGSKVDEMIRILARSRQVELEITSSMFGSMIGAERVTQLQKDINDLEALVAEAGPGT
jgi:hypothetical protein